MCWTFTASIVFIFVYVIAGTIVWLANPKSKYTLVAFIAYFCGMEILQALQWSIGEVIGYYPDVTKCSLTNRYWTYVAFAYVFFQPSLFGLMGGVNYGWNKIWIRLAGLNIVIFLINFITLIVVTQINNPMPYTEITQGSFTNTTCTVIGPNSKLVWLFKVGDINYIPTFQIYMWLSIMVFVFYRMDLWAIPIAFFVTLGISAFAFPITSIELPSFWCLLSVIATPIIIGWVFLLKYFGLSDGGQGLIPRIKYKTKDLLDI